MVKLRDGTEVSDPRLGRLRQFDSRSRAFPIRALVAGKPLRSYTWRVGTWLDQGSEGACVGFSWAHELCARPVLAKVDDTYARMIYHEAQKIDPWPGEDYDGTSVLAGAQVCQGMGHFESYRWAFGLDDLVLAIGYAGPAVLGINWHDGMFEPARNGRIRPTGSVLGGHAILAYRVQVSTREPRVWLWNSWGPTWGRNGRCWLTFDDLEQLLHAGGEACVPMKRRRVET